MPRIPRFDLDRSDRRLFVVALAIPFFAGVVLPRIVTPAPYVADSDGRALEEPANDFDFDKDGRVSFCNAQVFVSGWGKGYDPECDFNGDRKDFVLFFKVPPAS